MKRKYFITMLAWPFTGTDYFAGWESDTDPDVAMVRCRAVEYADMDEADEDLARLSELGYEAEINTFYQVM